MGINLERQHVLTKKEKNVMRVIYQAADKKNGVCLISPIEIFEKLPLDIEYEEEELDTIMSNLAIDDYFDLTRSDKKGELVYCINMRQKGLAFARVERAFKSNVTFRLLLALACGVCSALAATGLKYLIEYLLTK
ncbi:MAG: hypothetical protein IJ978_01985 [Clostridia bacterium]|jgi:hypothetical protein|nr:hypothetical protein [Clostridia bacterium]MBR2056411.1 hypothetical protein [Clostridia bacterium]MBR2485508.1 hypothetical protein [Clostridia bacterium]MBR2919010.1 hypothetical protein [Clostridia bacterium]